MKKDLTRCLLSIDGDRLVFENSSVDMRKVIIDALLDSSIDDVSISGDEKLSRYLLAVKCKESSEVNFSPEQIVLLKRLIGRKHPPLIVGQFYIFIDDTISSHSENMLDYCAIS